MNNDNISISVIIPVKNGDAWLEKSIPAILEQELNGKLEIIVIDSGSNDETLQILSRYPVKIIKVSPNDFNHGLTRNFGAREAKGEYVVMTVQDATPVSKFWLKNLMNGFVDESVAAVCGQQIVPHQIDKNPVQWFRPISKPQLKKYYYPNGNFNELSSEEQLSICRWDNVNAMYKREALLELPFRKTDFAEDALWARDALSNRFAIVYSPVSQVEHYHNEDYQFAFKRNFMIQYHFYKYFQVLPREQNNIKRLFQIVKILVKEPKISLFQKMRWFKYNFINLNAVKKSNELVILSLKKGGNEKLDRVYRNLSFSIPQAIKPGKA